MSTLYVKELQTAIRAVHLASLATKRLLPSKDKGSQPKADRSPVTIADYASQALLIAAVHHDFPEDHILGEESAAELRKNQTLCDQVWHLISTTLDQSVDTGASLYGELKDKDDMFRYIDMGGDELGGVKGRVWMLDPVDGTAAFLSGGQYAVCLALVEDGEQKVGVVGCPNAPFDVAQVKETVVDSDGYGSLLSAVKGHGTFVWKMGVERLGPPRKIFHKQPTAIRIVQPSNSAYDFGGRRKVADKLGAEWPGTMLWSSQTRFVALALGEGNAQIAFRKRRDYHSCVWDAAGGVLIFEEAGGRVTDVEGKPLDFRQGRRLEKNSGIVAALSGIHDRVLSVVREVDREPINDGV
ncbi:carbohydrate phosphatase [Glonium stellatum]|uniref:Carbohydrate phosphatase n=1 Tax=Glonium stellatum TaxID=574774 RepID=A0A8E2EVB6_9PEZI|nr:carbohydrate phosphatase [Glonium stellatum]